MFRIIREVKPAFVVCENVVGLISLENGKPFEGILTSLEAEGYEVESFVIPACGVGAWHRRDRVWIIAYLHDTGNRTPGSEINKNRQKKNKRRKGQPFNRISGQSENASNALHNGNRQSGQSDGQCKNEFKSKKQKSGTQHTKQFNELYKSGRGEIKDVSNTTDTRIKRMYKRENSTIRKQWNIEPELARVVHGIPNRVERLKGLGNAIVPQVALEIFKAIELKQL